MIVRIVKDWKYPESFFSQTPGGSKRWADIEFTEECVEHCDYLIVLQRPPYNIRVTCPEGNAWLITQEPPVNYFRFYIKSFKYFDKVFTYYSEIKYPPAQSLQPVLPWHVLRSYDELMSITRESLANKKNELTWITSNKDGFPGQKARMYFRDYLLKSHFRFHFYGRGFVPIHDKFDGLFPNKYALAIENYSVDHYWTEKIADSFLSWCLPFYWGAGNLEDYFPPQSFIRIDVNRPEEALQIINRSMQNNEWEKRLSAIEKARNLILNEYQFFPYIAKMIIEDSHKNQPRPAKHYRIPANPYPFSHKIMNKIKYYSKRALELLGRQAK
jgi:hypothetical protein